jgi:polyribonucleotide nucleotidyltransferase
MSKKQTFEMEFAGKQLIVETGELALQANASCTVRYGDTVVLATAVMNKDAREGLDFFPLMVEFEEKMYAAGKIKGSRFVKREGRPTDEAVLTGRMIDRGLRPLFDQSIRRDVQVITSVLSFDEENDADVIAIIAASIVLHISDIPWNGPLAGIRIGKIDNEWVINPTYSAREKSSLDLTLSVSEDKVLMVDSSANDVDGDTMYEAFEFAIKHGRKVVNFIDDIRKKVGKEKQVIAPAVEVEESFDSDDSAQDLRGKDENKKMSEQQLQELETECKEKTLSMLDKYLFNIPHGSKGERKIALKAVKDALDEFLTEKQIGKDRKKKVMKFFYPFIDEQITKAILEREQRIDGRKMDEIRPLSAKIDLLPRTHGSGLFSRGETQVLSIVTLGSPGDEQTVDGMEGDFKRRYMHHYNFPPFSVGEAKPLRGAGRRDIGHGALAEKALAPVLPSRDDFPYTIRVVSEVMGSNGSSSMGSTCGSTIALMAAGVPIKKPVAGIAIGIASNEKGEFKVLTDIQDFEDGDGGMDFKVTGTRDGITAIQMDTKTVGLTLPLIKEAIPRAMKAINEIIDVIEKEIPEPKKEMSQYAPRIIAMKINPDKIRDVIGPGGKMINEIIDTTGVQIDIEDDGTVMITSNNEKGSAEAVQWIEDLTQEAKVGENYVGTVVKIMDFGAFVEIFPGTDGMVHISEITDKERVEDVSKYLKEGQKVKVKVLKVDDVNGKISLSIKKA